MTKYQNKYRIESTRLQSWDYGEPGWYFVTICTQNHLPTLGRVERGQMARSSTGDIVAGEWLKTANIRENVELDAWVIMPNHLHGIVIIIDFEMLQPENGNSKGNRSWKPGTLGSIINQFKGVCTRSIRRTHNPNFAWQSRFYEHIIRNDRALDRIRTYIENNPAKWEIDSLYVADKIQTPRLMQQNDDRP